MQFGLVISVLLHVAILGGALISIQSSRQELRLAETEPVAVGMIAPSDVTKVKQGVRTAKLLEAAEAKESPKGDLAKKEATKPKMAATAPPPPPPPEDKAELAPPKVIDPPPAPAAEAQKKLEAEQQKLAEQQKKLAEEQRLAEQKQRAEEQAKAEALKRAEEKRIAEERKIAEAQRLAEEKKRAEEEQRRLEEQRKQAELKKKREEERKRKQAELKKKRDAEKKRLEEEERKRLADEASKKQSFSDKMSALLNKIPDAAPPPPSSAGDQPTKAKGPTLGAPDGKDKQLSASEKALIAQTIKSCVQPRWNVLSGGASARETVVKIRIRFNADGTLSAPPEIKPPPGTPTPYFRAISESALRAVQECEPYNLPPDLYDHWKDIQMSFSPTDMY